MPFQYDTRPNPFVGSIGDMIARRGNIEANRAIGVANATAGAEATSGQAWAQAGQQIAQTVAAPLAREAQAMSDPTEQLKNEQLKAAQRENRSRNIFELELRNPKNYNEDGSINDDAITAALKKQDVGAWQSWATISAANQKNALDLKEKALQIQNTGLDVQTKQKNLRDAQTTYLGGLAFHTEQALQTNAQDPLHARDTFMAGVARAGVDGGLTADQVRSVLSRTAGASPDQLQQVLASLVPPEQRAALEEQTAKTRKANAEAGLAEAEARQGGKVTDAQLTNELVGLYAKQSAGTPLTAVETARLQGFEAKEGQKPITIKTMQNGQPVEKVMTQAAAMKAGVFPSQPPASIQLQGAAAAAANNMPGWALDASRPVGAEGNVMHPTLHMTPNGLYQDAQTYIATGSYPPTGRGADPASVAKRGAIDAKVGAIAADAGMDVPTLRAFYRANSGSLQQLQKAADAASSNIATADRNVALLEQVLPKIGDLGGKLFNQPLRSFEKNVEGDVNLSKMATYLRSVQNEYAQLIQTSPSGSAGPLSDSARHEAEQLIDGSASVAQIVGSIQALKAEGANRLLSMGEQIQRVGARMQRPAAAPAGGPPPAAAGPQQGDVRPIAGHPDAEQTFNGTTWVRSK